MKIQYGTSSSYYSYISIIISSSITEATEGARVPLGDECTATVSDIIVAASLLLVAWRGRLIYVVVLLLLLFIIVILV